MENWNQTTHCDLNVVTTLGRLKQRVAEVRRQSGQDEGEKGEEERDGKRERGKQGG